MSDLVPLADLLSTAIVAGLVPTERLAAMAEDDCWADTVAAVGYDPTLGKLERM